MERLDLGYRRKLSIALGRERQQGRLCKAKIGAKDRGNSNNYEKRVSETFDKVKPCLAIAESLGNTRPVSLGVLKHSYTVRNAAPDQLY